MKKSKNIINKKINGINKINIFGKNILGGKMTNISNKLLLPKGFFEKMQDDHISEYAAECAYFTIFSFIPFIIFFLTLIQFTTVDKENIFYWVGQVVPTSMNDTIVNIIEEVYSKSFGTISISGILALWSSSQGFYYLSKGLRHIYGTKKTKTNIIVRIEGILYTLIFIISIIAFLLIMLLGQRIHNVFNKIEALSIITSYILKIRGLLLVIPMFIVFLFIYKFVPKHKLPIKYQIVGAAFSSIAWYIVSWFFSIYINLFDGFSNTYGSLTSIILIMMWVYVCMFIILIGAEINYFIYYKNYGKEFQ